MKIDFFVLYRKFLGYSLVIILLILSLFGFEVIPISKKILFLVLIIFFIISIIYFTTYWIDLLIGVKRENIYILGCPIFQYSLTDEEVMIHGNRQELLAKVIYNHLIKKTNNNKMSEGERILMFRKMGLPFFILMFLLILIFFIIHELPNYLSY